MSNTEKLTDALVKFRDERDWEQFHNPKDLAIAELDLIIKNNYRTSITRGIKGCYIFSDDEETRDWFRGI